MTTTITETIHSRFAPSAASRWLRCPGSVAACATVPDPGSAAADEGTHCHSIMEAYYSGDEAKVSMLLDKRTQDWQVDAIEKAQELTDALLADRIALYGPPELHLEVKVTMREAADLFGTVDMIAYWPALKHLLVLDYKFGIGEVEAENNEQLSIYAAAAHDRFPYDTVSIVVIQPRVSNPCKVWTTTRTQLGDWLVAVVSPALQAARQPDAPRIAGPVQCKWCNFGRRVGCPEATAQGTAGVNGLIEARSTENTQAELAAIMAVNLNPAVPEVKPEPTDWIIDIAGINALDLATIALKLPMMKVVIKQIEEVLTTRLEAGEEIPGFKLVYTKKNRTWKDEEKADGFLQRKKLTLDERAPRKLVSPSQAEKLIGYKNLPAVSKKAFQELVIVPAGDLTYAHESDKRPAVTPEVLYVPEATTEVAVDVTTLF
jgi:hypothetical protein